MRAPASGQEDRAMSYEVSPLAEGTPFGATVTGLTLADLDEAATRRALFDLWIDRGVILFRGGDSATEMQLALSRCFGELELHMLKDTWVDGHPELVQVKYFPDNGNCYEIDGELRGGFLPWHSDLVYSDSINRGGILRPVKLPRRDGMTGFVDQIAAYDRLPDALKARVEGLHVVYALNLNLEHLRYGRPKQVRFVRGARSFENISRREYQYPRVLHPMVYTQEETGRKVLNVSAWFALGIYELGGPEGEALLGEVIDHCTDPANAYFHDWRYGDMILWDNWRTLHCATGVAADDTREMQRTTISGDYALGRKLDGAPKDLEMVDV
jgi:taurine dioxygenase